ncbi:putative 60s ribosomal protein l20 protein [Botrytis fragariae]|uniref:Putative 60s ribosomal protein l20 protein n=1 Tax=Botrytis fragariae TaxID=1964551 RepID=A0A8H6EE93_9HELO|nr:putative 60s ribosomal protein l20 protein [Botrytis fragariae]KAF5868996.1 putative 60s ribosomal protein l20 protein [Botrytis fragariae]
MLLTLRGPTFPVMGFPPSHKSTFTSIAKKSTTSANPIKMEWKFWKLTCFPLGRLREYQVIGRHLPSEANPAPKLYRMRIFAPNTVVAKSRFWYFLMKLRKVKKANGEIVSLNEISEKRPMKVKNFGIWIRYDSRSGTHNMYKEYREMSRTDAVEALYQDMAARHRSRFRSIHILKVVEIEKTEDVKRPYIKQLLEKDLKFPLPHRISKSMTANLFASKRPSTFY